MACFKLTLLFHASDVFHRMSPHWKWQRLIDTRNHCQLFLTPRSAQTLLEHVSSQLNILIVKIFKQVIDQLVSKWIRINKIRKTQNRAEKMHPVNDKWTHISELNASPIIILKYTYSISYHKSVRLSVRASVCLSVTRWHCVKMTPITIMRSSLEDSPMTLVSSWLTLPLSSKVNIGNDGAKWERGRKNRQFLANKSPYLGNGAR